MSSTDRRPEPDGPRWQLAAIPTINQAARPNTLHSSSTAQAFDVELLYSSLLRPIAGLIGLRRHRTLLVEGRGLEILRLIDGRSTVETIIDQFREPHGLTFFEARALVLTYLGTLTRRGLVTAIVPK
jgi:hypothetical protein